MIAAGLAVLGLGTLLLGARVPESANGANLVCVLAWWIVGGVVVPWFVSWFGIQVVHGALEDRTFQYLFLRPVGKVPLLLGRFVATAVIGATVAALAVAVIHGAMAVHGEIWPDGVHTGPLRVFAGAMALGSIAYAAAAMVFATVFRRPLLWATFFVVGLQQLTANLPVSAGLRQLTIT
ncbi:MAG: ABC transporter permease subunit, partial [Planctomycetes bacterium]|nr:ABC transporter permease subunit [Planctomycetota bacterium]